MGLISYYTVFSISLLRQSAQAKNIGYKVLLQEINGKCTNSGTHAFTSLWLTDLPQMWKLLQSSCAIKSTKVTGLKYIIERYNSSISLLSGRDI